ncbi:hypothetical protein JHK86_025112 [Glycine max]|nr:hypothetical protein JHK86_025112 [Glycine max]
MKLSPSLKLHLLQNLLAINSLRYYASNAECSGHFLCVSLNLAGVNYKGNTAKQFTKSCSLNPFGAALTWYDGLPPRLTNNFDTLVERFSV